MRGPGPGTHHAGMRRVSALAFVAFLLCTAGAAVAKSRDGVRASTRCAGAHADLTLSEEDGQIEVEFELEGRTASDRWRIAVVHERRVSWVGSRSGSLGRLRVQRVVRDFAGDDHVAVTASRLTGGSCRVAATLPAG